MKPIKKILVPVDFSMHTAQAVQFAADLSRRYEAPLELLHVLEPTVYALPAAYVLPTPEQSTHIMEGLRTQLSSTELDAVRAGAWSVSSTLVQGSPIGEILRIAKEAQFDLIVMGTHGRTGIKHVLLGSVAENVARTASCPVLIVRADG